MASIAFQFIDHSAIDVKSRKAIRSHVMKGKNAGKVRAPRRKPVTTLEARPAATAPAVPAALPTPPIGSEAAENHSAVSLVTALTPMTSRGRDMELLLAKIPGRVGDEFDGLTLIYEASTQAKRLLHSFLSSASEAVYPQEFSVVPEVAQRVWVQFIYADEACFHSFVSMSAAYLDAITKQSTRSLSNWHHHARALRLISSKISKAQGVTDFALASVIALSLQESLRGQMQHAKLHVEGLFRMVEVRGGLEGLESNPALVEKVKRVDIDVAFKLGLPLHFKYHAIHPDSRAVSPFHLDCELPQLLESALQYIDMDVYLVARGTKRMAYLISLGAAVHKIEPLVFQEMLTLHCYRLLNIDIVGGKRLVNPLARAVHLVLICFMATCIDLSDRQGILGYPLLCQKTKGALDNEDFYQSVEPEANLWALMIFGIAVADPQNMPWLRAKICCAAEQACIADWRSAKLALNTYGWIPSLHDDRGLNLWNKCHDSICQLGPAMSASL